MIVMVIVPAVGFVAFLGVGSSDRSGQLGPDARAAVIEDRWRCRFMQIQNKREKALLYKARVLFFTLQPPARQSASCPGLLPRTSGLRLQKAFQRKVYRYADISRACCMEISIWGIAFPGTMAWGS